MERKTVAAANALAAYVKASTKYSWIARLQGNGSWHLNPVKASNGSQSNHDAKTEYSGADDGHHPMKFRLSRPTVPSLRRNVSNC
jgi:hypothetical protein